MLKFKIYKFPDMFRQKSCYLQGVYSKTISCLIIRQLCWDLFKCFLLISWFCIRFLSAGYSYGIPF
jgi:hypothetical protein